MIKPELHLIGAGGFAKDFIACFRKEYEITGCWDDQLTRGSEFNGIPVLGSVDDLLQQESPLQLVVTIANPAVRNKISQNLSLTKHNFPAIIHPGASVFDSATIHIGKGCILFPSVIITTRVSLGDFVILHAAVSVHHDVTIGKCSVLMPGARITGDVTIGQNVFVGPGKTLSHGDNIPDGETRK